MLNYQKLIELNPTVYTTLVNAEGQTIELVEHPLKGDEAQVIAVCHELKLAAYTGFYDTEDMTQEHKEYEPSFTDGKLFIGMLLAE